MFAVRLLILSLCEHSNKVAENHRTQLTNMSSTTFGFSRRFGISLIIFFLVLNIQATYGEIQFLLSRNKGTWKQAFDSCKSIRGSLAILDNIELQRSFDRDVKPNPMESVWVGRYVGYTPAVTIDGCYRNQTLEIKRSSVLVNNYLVTCLKECPDTAYVGMQGQFCYCVDSITTKAVVVPGVYCRSDCPGERSGSSGTMLSGCGIPDVKYNTVSVYRKVRQNEIVLDINVPNQGECIAYNARGDKWQPLDCSQPQLFSCDKLQCSGPPSMCVMKSTLPATWFQARTTCEGANSRLAIINATTHNYFKQTAVVRDPLYWTGLHRKEVTVWSYDTNPNVIEQSDRCFAAVKQQNGGWQLVMDWCSKEHKYACVQGNETKSTPTPDLTTTSSVAKTTTTQVTIRSTTSDSLPTVDPFAKPISVKSSAERHFIWIQNIAYATIFQLFTLTMNVRLLTRN